MPNSAPPLEERTPADVILMRLDAPFEPGHGSIAEFFHGGTLDFDEATLTRIASHAAIAPVFLSVFLERPAVLAPIVPQVAMLIADFGASDRVIVDAFRGAAAVTGKLPFDIPSSMAAVERSREDVPFDTESPLYRAGYGITRPATA